MEGKELITYCIRGCESVFCIITLGLSAGLLNDVGGNVDRVTFALVTSILNILYFGYIGGIMPYVTVEQSPSSVIFASEIILAIFYLAAMGAIADITPTTSCSFFGFHNDDTICSLLKALIPFTLFNWLLFSGSFTLFLVYSFIPEMQTYGFAHTFKFTTYQWGAIWSDYSQAACKPIGGVANKEAGVAGAGEGAAVGDEEANVGVHSTDEEARENKYPEHTDESDHNPNDEANYNPNIEAVPAPR
ncbi:uncharacterized protein J8A68_001689 [[Candida] subhashii]|uniref:MARVEL domain-containing protein n=1 Tax=[Candida] subhashii TaxID=561895 RepID=A0A8J5QTF1_9ASCO|nr:uncharacterized protein J8A68_001689 [[Candida] subhashii]KAG7664807.1 hypothetical protein J8A68_001689 [[Candida] subhashii]